MESNIRLLRTERKLKQSQLGDQIGISQQAVSRLEKDSTAMTADTLVRLAAYFGVTCDYLLGVSEKRRGDGNPLQHMKDPDKFYELYHVYSRLSERDQKLLFHIGKIMEHTPEAQ